MSSSSFPSLHCHKKHHCQCHRHHSHDPKISSLLKLISDQVTENHKSMQHEIQKIAERVTVIEQQNTPSVETAQSTEKAQNESVQSAEKHWMLRASIPEVSRFHPTQIVPQPARLPSSWSRTPEPRQWHTHLGQSRCRGTTRLQRASVLGARPGLRCWQRSG